jgi:hypothetical protein
VKLTLLTAPPAVGALGSGTRNRRENLPARYVLGLEPQSQVLPRCRLRAGTEADISKRPFSRLDGRVPSPRASGRGIVDPENERVDVRHDVRHIVCRPTGARDLPRVIAALDKRGARPIRRLAAV